MPSEFHVPQRLLTWHCSSLGWRRGADLHSLSAGRWPWMRDLAPVKIIDGMPEDFALNYVVRGEGAYTDWRGRMHNLAPGAFYQRIPGKAHTTTAIGDARYVEYFLTMDAATCAELAGARLLDVDRFVGHAGATMELVERFEEIMHLMDADVGTSRWNAPLSKVIALLDRLYELDSSQGIRQADIRTACDMLAAHPEAATSMPQIAAQLGMSYEHFRKMFRRVVGLSPGEYRIRRRIQEASRLLQSGVSVGEVAHRLGYADPFAFSKQFKSRTGTAPSRYAAESRHTSPVMNGYR
jgi:AraC-like DNA-binding protein